MKPLLVTAREASSLLAVSSAAVYELAAAGELEKRYIGAGSRNFRITYESIEAYANRLPHEPIADTG